MTETSVMDKRTIVDGLSIDINVLNNPYNIPLEKLFEMAARINKKRSFLFVSKVLGKHLATPPSIPMITGRLLAKRYMETVKGISQPDIEQAVQLMLSPNQFPSMLEVNNLVGQIALDSPVTIIGFAETATALGHAVFSSFANNARYVHTTREQVCELSPLIAFEEEHSHATSHRIYTTDPSFFDDTSDIILVDDEITTGKTAINTIRSLKEHYPHKMSFTVISILDWRTAEHRERYLELEKELGIEIHSVSLLDGEIEVISDPIFQNVVDKSLPTESHDNSFFLSQEPIKLDRFISDASFIKVTSRNEVGLSNKKNYLQHTGRFGVTSEVEQEILEEITTAANQLREVRRGRKTLVVGTGEFMHIPMHIASMLGDDVYFQSTTRSPIYPTTEENYPIQQKLTFSSPENAGVINYLYNIRPCDYDEIFVLVERIASIEDSYSLVHSLKQVGIPHVHLVQLAN